MFGVKFESFQCRRNRDRWLADSQENNYCYDGHGRNKGHGGRMQSGQAGEGGRAFSGWHIRVHGFAMQVGGAVGLPKNNPHGE